MALDKAGQISKQKKPNLTDPDRGKDETSIPSPLYGKAQRGTRHGKPTGNFLGASPGLTNSRPPPASTPTMPYPTKENLAVTPTSAAGTSTYPSCCSRGDTAGNLMDAEAR
ncbi:unnamed protein product [Tuber aestivum]|uniref:Uncharacterized protein n=1 Tax=Tuber aestivum TaxID=59557 RepID=A0A292Q631_9PEZI|nr:unnamed protein product [Tuber aestivum]